MSNGDGAYMYGLNQPMVPTPQNTSWWQRNAPGWLGGSWAPAPAGSGPGGASSPDLAKQLGDLAKLGPQQPQGGGLGMAPAASGSASIGRGSGAGQLQNLLQMLMQRQQAYTQAAQGGGATVAQNPRTNQPGLLGL